MTERFVNHVCGYARYGSYRSDRQQTGMRRFGGRSGPTHTSLFYKLNSASCVYLAAPAMPVNPFRSSSSRWDFRCQGRLYASFPLIAPGFGRVAHPLPPVQQGPTTRKTKV
jgi:hypothetical protein